LMDPIGPKNLRMHPPPLGLHKMLFTPFTVCPGRRHLGILSRRGAPNWEWQIIRGLSPCRSRVADGQLPRPGQTARGPALAFWGASPSIEAVQELYRADPFWPTG